MRVNDFRQKLSKRYDALQTLGKRDTLAGLVMTTIDKLPHVNKPDLVKTDENWEKWDMGELITNLEKWIKRNKPSETSYCSTQFPTQVPYFCFACSKYTHFQPL